MATWTETVLPEGRQGRTRAAPPSSILVVSHSHQPSGMTDWVSVLRTTVSGNNDRSSETSLKPEHRGLTFSKLVSVGRLKWSCLEFPTIFLSWTRMRQWKFIKMQCFSQWLRHAPPLGLGRWFCKVHKGACFSWDYLCLSWMTCVKSHIFSLQPPLSWGWVKECVDFSSLLM